MKVFVSVLTLDSKVDIACTASLMANIKDLESKGHQVTLYFETANCYVSMARNWSLAHFLDSDADLMIFVDSDLWFDTGSMAKLVNADKPFIAGVYPYRDGNYGFPITTDGKFAGPNLLMAKWCTVGFSACKREIYEDLIKAHPEWLTECKTKKGRPVYAVYDIGLGRGDNHYWPEDFMFCHRLTDRGVPVLVDPSITFEHCGRKATRGSLDQYMKEIIKRKAQ